MSTSELGGQNFLKFGTHAPLASINKDLKYQRLMNVGVAYIAICVTIHLLYLPGAAALRHKTW